jgi:ADP-ribose pyrophosphatase YjhB (NUDIX family)
MRIRVAALVIREGRVLLARHVKNGRTSFLLPGGGVEADELSHDALARELREEASVGARIGALRYVVEARSPDGAKHLLQLVFSASIDGEVGASRDARVAACEWHDVASLESLDLHPSIGAAIAADLRDGRATCRYLAAPWVT